MDEHCFIIMYDLRAPGRDYQDLINAIKKYKVWGHLTESAWAVVTNLSAVDIRNSLMKYMDANDRIMVVQSGRNAAWNKCRASDGWIHENIIK